MYKIAFVIPWYGEGIPGGAEMELREVAGHLQKAGVEVEVLTTCVKDFTADWNQNYTLPGLPWYMMSQLAGFRFENGILPPLTASMPS